MRHSTTRAFLLGIVLLLVSILPGAGVADLPPPDYPQELIIRGEEYDYLLLDGQATITGHNGNGYGEVLEIPAELDGYPVVVIGEQAFIQSGLTGVVIPEGVTSIADGAFYYCESLVNINLPNSLIAIGECAFIGCGGLGRISIPNGVTTLGKDAFSHCANLEAANLPESITHIGQWAFDDCPELTLTVVADSYGEQYAWENGIPCTEGREEEKGPLFLYSRKGWLEHMAKAASALGVPVTGELEVFHSPSNGPEAAYQYVFTLAGALTVRVFADEQDSIAFVWLEDEPPLPEHEFPMRAAITAVVMTSDPIAKEDEAWALSEKLCEDYASFLEERQVTTHMETLRDIPYALTIDRESKDPILLLVVGDDTPYVPSTEDFD